MSIKTKSPSRKRNNQNNSNQRKERSPSVTPQASSSLQQAAKDGKVDELILLLKRGHDVNSQDNFGTTPLHLACFHRQIECVSALLENHAEINCRDIFGRTPLLHAARNGHKSIMLMLLKKGAEINPKSNTGETPLLKAAYYGHLDCLKVLINFSKNADTNIINDVDYSNCNSSLHNAASKGHAKCVEFLLTNEANVNALNNNDNTPLHLAVLCNHFDCVQVLCNYGANLEIKNKSGKNPIEEATQSNFREIVQFLRNQKKTKMETRLQELRKKDLSLWNSQDVAKWLVTFGFGQYKDSFIHNDINGQNLHKLTMTSLKTELHITSYGHRISILEGIHNLYKSWEQEKEEKEKPLTEIEDDNSVQDFHPEKDYSEEVWKIDYNELEMKETLGRGFYGEVKKALWKGTEVAVKVIYRDTFASQKDLSLFYKELNIISKLRHTRILMFLGACLQDGNRCIVTEYLPGGSLHRLIHEDWAMLSRNFALQNNIISDIVKGMTYLHDKNIIHRDLTPWNLLLDANMNCKVCDFGLSRIRKENGEMTAALGCLPYQSPEVFKGEKYSELADVYSFGIVLYELTTGKDPHHDLEPQKFANMVAYENYRPPIPETNRWTKLIGKCWDQDASVRPSFKEILNQYLNLEESKFDSLKKIASKETIGTYIE